MTTTSKITSSSTAEYFSKNLQQVGFSSGTKAVLTILKEAIDNSLDACEEAGILPEINVLIQRVGKGTMKNSDLIRVRVDDNGPGLPAEDLPRVYGEYLASSKFGRGRCSRGQQGIGISAATTWAQLTHAQGVKVISKTKNMRQAVTGLVEVDIKKNQGVLRDKDSKDWDRPHGVSVDFTFDGRLQLNGEGGILTYLTGTSIVNPHLSMRYKILDMPPVDVERVTTEGIEIPEAVAPHPHTMKLGEFIAHSHLFGKVAVSKFLRSGFSRISDAAIQDLVKKGGISKGWLEKSLTAVSQQEMQKLYAAIQEIELMPPSTRSVLSIGEEGLSKSVRRLGEVDFFAVVSRKPAICDAKPVVVEVAIARLLKGGAMLKDESEMVAAVDGNQEQAQVLRFANRVPLQFDKSACAIVQAIESVNWKAYGLAQPKDSIPTGPYVIAVSVVSPFIKFKNASKETIDASEELVAEIRLALIQAGQRLSRHIKREQKAADLEGKIRHIEQFGPVLIETLGRIVKAAPARLKKAEEGLMKILGRDAKAAESELAEAEQRAAAEVAKRKARGGENSEETETESEKSA